MFFDHSVFTSMLHGQIVFLKNVQMSNTTGATCGASLSFWVTRQPPSFGGVHVAKFLVFNVCFVYYCVNVELFSHDVVSLFSTYEFRCPSCNFRLSIPTQTQEGNNVQSSIKYLQSLLNDTLSRNEETAVLLNSCF